MIRVYGASDDCIEVDGDIEAEFNVDSPTYLHFSDGTLLRVEYGADGNWLIECEHPGESLVRVRNVADSKAPNDYSMVAELDDDVDFVICNGERVNRPKPATPKWPQEHTIYLHRDKDSNWELGQMLGLTKEAIRNNFAYCGYEIGVRIRVSEDGSVEYLCLAGEQ